MKLSRRSILATALIFALPSVFAADLPKLSVLTMPNFQPFEWKGDDGKMTGFDMDLIRDIGKIAGFEPVIKTVEFSGIVPALQTGSADIGIASIFVTPARLKVVDFSTPYYKSGGSILVRANNDSIKSMKDLAGKKVGTLTGSGSYNYIAENAPQADNIAYPSAADLYMALMGNAVDAIFHDSPNVAYFVKTKGQDKVKIVGPVYNGVDLAIAMPKGSKWVKPIDDAMAKLKADGTYKDLYVKYFGSEPPKE